jgi:membrane protein
MNLKSLKFLTDIPRLKRLAAHVSKHFKEERLFDEAASLSYTSLLSMVPLLAVIFGVASAFPVFQQWTEQIQTFVFNNFVPASGEQVQIYLMGFLDAVGQLTLPGMVLLILTALLLIVRIERAFNLIWRVPAARSVRDRIVMYWSVLTLGPLAVGAAIALSAQPIFEQYTLGVTSASFWRGFGIFSLSWLGFTMMFMLVPHRRVHIVYAATGALVSAVLFAMAKKLFVTFVANASFNVIYGTLASIPIFLFWLYVVWIVVLLGALLAASLTTFSDRETDWGWPPKWEFLLAYRLVGFLFKAQMKGETISPEDLLMSMKGMTDSELSEQLQQLFEAGIVTRSEMGDWLLCCDLESVTLLDLYRAGKFYLPINEKLEVPSHGEWDKAFFRSIKLGEMNMNQSLKSMYKKPERI